jgi:hypothetical protein
VNRARSKIAMLPEDVRAQINRKIRDGWKYGTIRDWLFLQHTEQDIPDLGLKAGECFALAWTRDAKDERANRHSCISALSYWFKHRYPGWLAEQLSRDRALRVVEESERLSSLAGDKSEPGSNVGGNLIIRSLLLEAIRAHCEDKEADPAHLARLANAWARMNDSGIRGQEALDAGLQQLRDEIKDNPKALEQFNKLYGTLKGRTEQTP